MVLGKVHTKPFLLPNQVGKGLGSVRAFSSPRLPSCLILPAKKNETFVRKYLFPRTTPHFRATICHIKMFAMQIDLRHAIVTFLPRVPHTACVVSAACVHGKACSCWIDVSHTGRCRAGQRFLCRTTLFRHMQHASSCWIVMAGIRKQRRQHPAKTHASGGAYAGLQTATDIPHKNT